MYEEAYDIFPSIIQGFLHHSSQLLILHTDDCFPHTELADKLGTAFSRRLVQPQIVIAFSSKLPHLFKVELASP